VNALWAGLLIRVGRRSLSPALTADGRHLLADVVTSAGVILGLLLALATGWYVLDPLLASLVALNILWTGWRVVGESMSGLMDRATPPEMLAEIRKVIGERIGAALEVHDLKTRLAGPAAFIEFHLVVPAAMTVAESHRICDRIESALGEAVPGARVLIHVEPEGEAKGSGVRVS
jgi:cation diffusion facilitator family transporter